MSLSSYPSMLLTLLALQIPLTTSSPISQAAATFPCATPDSTMPLWIISKWTTDFTIPDGQTVLFNLENTLTGYTALCFREGPFPEGLCGPTEDSATEGDDTGTIFSYNEHVGELEVYQEWTCGGEGDSATKRVQADSGKVNVTLACTLGEEMKKGEMCGLEGAGGEIYINRFEVVG